jgi:hypothetical protein
MKLVAVVDRLLDFGRVPIAAVLDDLAIGRDVRLALLAPSFGQRR